VTQQPLRPQHAKEHATLVTSVDAQCRTFAQTLRPLMIANAHGARSGSSASTQTTTVSK